MRLASVGAGTEVGARPVPSAASGSPGRCPSSIRCGSDRGRVYAGQLAGRDRRRSEPLPNDSLSGVPLASGRPSGPVPARICVCGYGEAPELVSSSQWPGAGQGGSEVLLRGAPSLARSRADRHPGDPPRGDVLVRGERWQEGLSVWSPLPQSLPPLRMLLVLLFGHYSVDFVLWLFAHGIMPLYTPLGGSWNMAESIQRILKRRDGQHPTRPAEIIAWLEAAARGWNREPTPFIWGGKRQARRARARQRGQGVGGSGVWTRRPLTRSWAA